MYTCRFTLDTFQGVAATTRDDYEIVPSDPSQVVQVEEDVGDRFESVTEVSCAYTAVSEKPFQVIIRRSATGGNAHLDGQVFELSAQPV